jgi:hypothetical protein
MYRGHLNIMAPILTVPSLIASLLSFSLAGLSGCGPAAPDYSQSLDPRAALSASSKSQSVTQHAWSPVKTSVAQTVGRASESSHAPTSTQAEAPPQPDHLAVPVWIAQALGAPEVSVRIQALDSWAQQGPQAPLGPLVVALDDENDDVRTKAMEIIERHWAIEQEAEAQMEK